jgi:predicted translin family RNA/ssDNA-binding protein
MDINYFLSSKKKLQKILSHLNEIKEIYCEIQIETCEDISYEYITQEVDEYEKKISELKLEIEHLNQFIFSNCEHTFVEDVIDITPDRSQNITYCTVCEYTKE